MQAVFFLDSNSIQRLSRRVAGLPLLKRNLRVLKRSGIRRATLVGGAPPRQAALWARQEDMEVEVADQWVSENGRYLVLPAGLAFHERFVEDLTRDWDGQGWRSFSLAGDSRPSVFLGQNPPAKVYSALSELQASIPSKAATQITTRSPCLKVRDRAEARRFHRLLEKDIVKSTDGLFAQWNRKISIPLSRVLAQLPITPNMVTYFTLLVAVFGAYWLSRGGYWEMLLGAALTQLASILDGNDGELARMKLMDSDFGCWLDTVCDYVSYFVTFGAISYGLFQRSGDPAYLVLGGLMFAGFALGMLLTARLRRRYTSEQGAHSLTSVVVESLEENRRDWRAAVSARLRHFATRATFAYYVLAFAVLDWWLVLFGICLAGSHVYWMAALYTERLLKRRVRSAPTESVVIPAPSGRDKPSRAARGL